MDLYWLIVEMTVELTLYNYFINLVSPTLALLLWICFWIS